MEHACLAPITPGGHKLKALILCPDTKPAQSLRYMLERAEVQCFVPSPRMMERISRHANTVVSNQTLVRDWGYPKLDIPYTEDSTFDYVFDIKAHQNHERLSPFIKGRFVWYRINGGQPEVTVHGDEINPGVPVLTPNQWYKCPPYYSDHVYVFWPHLLDKPEHLKRTKGEYTAPIVLIHNFAGWGYGKLEKGLLDLGVKIYGRGSYHGVLKEDDKLKALNTALCLLHPKSTDSPGYALLEAMNAACPIVISRRLLWRSYYDILTPGVNCLGFDRETHDPLSDGDVDNILEEISTHFETLRDVYKNDKMGLKGRRTYTESAWRLDDINSFKSFLLRIK